MVKIVATPIHLLILIRIIHENTPIQTHADVALIGRLTVMCKAGILACH